MRRIGLVAAGRAEAAGDAPRWRRPRYPLKPRHAAPQRRRPTAEPWPAPRPTAQPRPAPSLGGGGDHPRSPR
eukprot:1199988-Pyramimonas_sp.AAC.1